MKVLLGLLLLSYGCPAQSVDWLQRGKDDLQSTLTSTTPVHKPAKNVIMFLGDGMGISTVTAARIFKAQQAGLSMTEGGLNWESFPFTGISKTYNTDSMTPDSAGTATAFMCGEKARASVVGVNQNVELGNCAQVAGNECRSFIHHAMDTGKWGGVVSTARITHATPACAYAHTAHRNWEDDSSLPKEALGVCKDIADQLVTDEDNKKLRVLLGGGRSNFFPNTTQDPEDNTTFGRRQDERDLVDIWTTTHEGMSASDRVRYVDKKSQFEAIDASNTDYLLGLFQPSSMKYEADRLEEQGEWSEPSLANMTTTAIDILSRAQQGYVLLVEGGRIDHGHHESNAYRALMDTVAFDDAIKVAMDKTSESDTLIVVTADHSHVFTIAGYPRLENDILGLVENTDGELMLGDDGKPYTVLGYANGPGFRDHRIVNDTEQPRKNLSTLSSDDMKDKDYRQDSGVPLYSESHGGEDVGIYARGPMSHLFTGTHEQNYIAHAIMYAACVGWNQDLCDQPTEPPPEFCGAEGLSASHLTPLALLMVLLTLRLLHL